MSNTAYHTQIFFDAVRCLALAGVATAFGWIVGGQLPRKLDWRGWALIAAPLCTPALLVSYTYANLALRLTGTPWLLALFYSALIALKLIPLAVIARRMFPSPITAEARFCEALIPNRSFASRLAFRLQALSPVPWITGALVFLLAFTDFELASLLSIKTWTAQLFDAHAGGLALSESLQRVSGPLCIEIVIILALILLARRTTAGEAASQSSTAASRWALPVSGVISLVNSIWPIVKVASHSMPGWSVIGVREAAGEEVLMSLATALVSTLSIWLTLAIVRRNTTRFAIALPGLLGALVLSLMILAVLHAQLPGYLGSPIVHKNWAAALGAVGESPLPLVFAETLMLAPVAALLWFMLASRNPGEKLHLARMAGSRRLIWELALEPRAAALGLLFLLSYFEFTAASILAPVQLTPVCVRLHNLAHYGQTSALSAMLFSATMAPIIVLALTLGGARFYARQNAR
jgi:hypothetical protein